MNDEDKKKPEEVADSDLDDATGGILLGTGATKVFDGGHRRTLTAASGIDDLGDLGETDTAAVDINIDRIKR